MPVAPHVAFLQIAIAKGNLASVAGIRVGSGGIHFELWSTDKGLVIVAVQCCLKEDNNRAGMGDLGVYCRRGV